MRLRRIVVYFHKFVINRAANGYTSTILPLLVNARTSKSSYWTTNFFLVELCALVRTLQQSVNVLGLHTQSKSSAQRSRSNTFNSTTWIKIYSILSTSFEEVCQCKNWKNPNMYSLIYTSVLPAFLFFGIHHHSYNHFLHTHQTNKLELSNMGDTR